jgi:hypothetical protein
MPNPSAVMDEASVPNLSVRRALERFPVKWIRFTVRKRSTLKAGDESTWWKRL